MIPHIISGKDKIYNHSQLIQVANLLANKLDIDAVEVSNCKPPRDQIYEVTNNSATILYSKEKKPKDLIFSVVDHFVRKIANISQKSYYLANSISQSIVLLVPALATSLLTTARNSNCQLFDISSNGYAEREYHH